MESLKSTKHNLLTLGLAVIIATVATIYAPYPDGAGMTLLVMIWVPLVVGLFTLGTYFLVRAVAGSGEWIATALGVVFMIFWSLFNLWR